MLYEKKIDRMTISHNWNKEK